MEAQFFYPLRPDKSIAVEFYVEVEFFNLIQELKLSKQEKADQVAFLRAL